MAYIERSRKELQGVAERQLRRLRVPPFTSVYVSIRIPRPSWAHNYDGHEIYGITDIDDNVHRNPTTARAWINIKACIESNIDPVQIVLHEVRHIYNWVVVFPDQDEKLALRGEIDDYLLYKNG